MEKGTIVVSGERSRRVRKRILGRSKMPLVGEKERAKRRDTVLWSEGEVMGAKMRQSLREHARQRARKTDRDKPETVCEKV